jgi:NAD+ kinase
MDDPEETQILVAFKKTRLEHHEEARDEGASERGEREEASVESLRKSHQTHRRAVEAVVDHLESEGFSPDVSYRGGVHNTEPYDLIVTVGGDGTVLDLSHKVEGAPILAINSDPDSSVGYFCAGTADEFPGLVASTLVGELPAFDLLRFRIRVDGEPTGPPVLNDILFAHEHPAAASKYVLEAGENRFEEQCSSGVWVATPAGSTAALRSAGGTVLPLGCNHVEYLVREPYPHRGDRNRLVNGIQSVEDRLRIRSRMDRGRVYIDGPHIWCEVGFEETVAIDADAPSLRLLGLDIERRTAQ